jgi:hypothetical protein
MLFMPSRRGPPPLLAAPPDGPVWADSARRRSRSAGPCPKNSQHDSTRIYRETKRDEFCVCDQCGHTWHRPQ